MVTIKMNASIFSNLRHKRPKKAVRLPSKIYHNLFLWRDIRSNKYIIIISTLILEKGTQERSK